MPYFAGSRILSYRWADSSNAFVGMQPRSRQVPPSRVSFSMIAVLRPSCEQRTAATYPPLPAALASLCERFSYRLPSDPSG